MFTRLNKNRRKAFWEKFLDIFDERGNKTGERMEKETAIKSGKLIKAFQIWDNR